MGNSLRTAPETKKTILSVAIKTGFHSLVELIAPHEMLEAKIRAWQTPFAKRGSIWWSC